MNYWPAEVANLAECHEPLFDLIDRLRVTGAGGRRGCTTAAVASSPTTTPTSGRTTAPLDNVFCGPLARRGGLARAPPLGALRLRSRRGVPARARLPGDEGGGALRARLPGRGSRDRRARSSARRSHPRAQYHDANGIRSGLCMSPAGDTQIISGLFERCLEAAADPRRRRGLPRRAAAAAAPPAGDAGRRARAAAGVAGGPRRVGARAIVTSPISSRSTPTRRSRSEGHAELARAARRALELRIDEASDRLDRWLERRVALAALGTLPRGRSRRTSS